MPSKMRLQRIADRIQQDLAQLIIRKVNDPRISGITVTGVKVDRELAFADVFVSAVEGSSRSKEVIAGLEHASGFLRHALSEEIELRVFPRLRFHWDPTPEHADHIEQLLASLRTPTSPIDEVEPEDEVDSEDELETDDDEDVEPDKGEIDEDE